jgi:hypothetical protein
MPISVKTLREGARPLADRLGDILKAGLEMDPAALLHLLRRRTVVQNFVYRDQTIHLDGFHFTNCRFERCTLASDFGDFTLTRCFISPDSRLGFSSALVRVIRLFHLSVQQEVGPGFRPQIDENGLVTIEDAADGR